MSPSLNAHEQRYREQQEILLAELRAAREELRLALWRQPCDVAERVHARERGDAEPVKDGAVRPPSPRRKPASPSR